MNFFASPLSAGFDALFAQYGTFGVAFLAASLLLFYAPTLGRRPALAISRRPRAAPRQGRR